MTSEDSSAVDKVPDGAAAITVGLAAGTVGTVVDRTGYCFRKYPVAMCRSYTAVAVRLV